jgi:hypothetical protein
VRDGSDCGFGWFRSGFLRRAVIGGIYLLAVEFTYCVHVEPVKILMCLGAD